MNILSDEQHQMLTFVGACNRYDYNPTGEQVMLWMQNPQPAGVPNRRGAAGSKPDVDAYSDLDIGCDSVVGCGSGPGGCGPGPVD
jgi:hypothetical protein